MRFDLFALPILAVLVDAAAIKPSSSSSNACTTCPVTIKDTAAAIASVYSQMAAQSPKQIKASATTTVIGTPIASSGVAKMTTATSSTKAPTSTFTSSSKKLHRRDTSSSTSTSTININSACATQPSYGYTYVPSSGDSTKFLKDSTLRSQYMTQNVPAGYTWSFSGFYASQLQSGYLFSTDNLSSYNVTQCAAICTGTSACKGFNIYFERDPTVLPAAGCPNPAPQTNVRCAFYGQAVSEQYAVNIGSWRNSFAVLITGNNGYNKQ